MQNILEMIIEGKSRKSDQFNSFLSVIGRSYDEDLISRLVAYSLSLDKSFVKKLIEQYIQKFPECVFNVNDILKCDVNVVCEKLMGKGRADIFVEIKDGNEKIATITIENKIYSSEHDNQTQTYFNWVTKNYNKNCLNTFFYLRPEFNHTEAVCSKYINITYSDLLNWIEADDYIINDLKNHIKNYLGDVDMTFTETQIEIINNYSLINDAVSETRKKFKLMQEKIIQKIEKELRFKVLDWKENKSDSTISKETANYGFGIGSYRLFKNEWRCEQYYFYIEIKFVESKLNNIIFQKTIFEKTEDGIIPEFLESKFSEMKWEEHEGQHYVIEKKEYFDDSWTEPGWDEKFIKEAAEVLQKYIIEMDSVFQKFLEYKNNTKNYQGE